jgi:hypothetical protein
MCWSSILNGIQRINSGDRLEARHDETSQAKTRQDIDGMAGLAGCVMLQVMVGWESKRPCRPSTDSSTQAKHEDGRAPGPISRPGTPPAREALRRTGETSDDRLVQKRCDGHRVCDGDLYITPVGQTGWHNLEVSSSSSSSSSSIST